MTSPVQQQLPLWEVLPAPSDPMGRVVADAGDRVAWLRARSRGVTATDAAQFASDHAVQAVLRAKQFGAGFSGNVYTEHGKSREPELAAWMLREHGIGSSSLLFHAEHSRNHLATPDGLRIGASGVPELAEIKTTNKPWRSIPRHYLRQVWWQQYVLGAERTLVVWEQHEDFVPVSPEPNCRWVDRDEDEIAMLVHRAELLLSALHRGGR